ncbi:MAG: peptidyl-prolyl cis-trans isomerase [Sedimentisphaerales bacterium]|nr:peptidyl-prolyl cis-trans isomerase [Sedimentisphaerales bacterium]
MKKLVKTTRIPLIAVVLLVPLALAGAAVPETNKPGGASVSPAPQSAQVVGEIGEYVITREELREKLLSEIRPRGEEDTRKGPVTAEAVLRTMIAEKAMMMEGRKQGLLDDDILKAYIDRTRQRKLVGLLLTDYLEKTLSVRDAEIDQAVKANPKLSREQAKVRVQQSKARPLLERYYGQLVQKLHVKKVKDNFAKVSAIHNRLLLKPKEKRRESWIKNSQVREELTAAEKGLALATYDGGKVTLEDWFKTLCDIVPPRRPRDVGTAQGVDKLLENTLRPIIFAVEARAQGYDKNKKLLGEIKELEDRSLLGKVRGEKIRNVPEPNDAEIKAYFDANKEEFGKSASLKVDQFWCEDLKAAQKAKAMLADGKDFAAVKEACAAEKSDQPSTLYASGEGLFWDKLWKGDPNEVIGPVKGFYGTGIVWRLVKVLEKTPAEPQPYSDNVKNRVKWAIVAQRRQKIVDAYEAQLLEKYPHKLYAERIKDIDPLEVTGLPKASR